jgi:hypothetical protein
MDADKALERIRKLLAVAKDSRANEGEAANAAAMAARLMAKFDLEEADVLAKEADEGRADVVQETIEDTEFDKDLPAYYNRFATFLSDLFHCHAKVQRDARGKLRFQVFGYSKDVAVVRWLFLYVHDQANKLADERWKSEQLPMLKAAGIPLHASRRRGWKNGYKAGIMVNVGVRIHEVYHEAVAAAGHADGEIKTSDGRSLSIVKRDQIARAFKEQGEEDFKYDKARRAMPTLGFQDGLEDAGKVKINKVIDVPEGAEAQILLEM